VPWLALTLTLVLLGSLLEPTRPLVRLVAPALAALAGAALLWRAGGVWRGAAWGHLLLAAAEAGWAYGRWNGQIPALSWADGAALAGCLAWAYTLARLPGRRFPRLSLWFYLPAIVMAVGLSLLGPDPGALLGYSFLTLGLLILAMFYTDAAVLGVAPEGRLLWIIGLFIAALSTYPVAWLRTGLGYEHSLAHYGFVLGYLFTAVGGYLEARPRPLGLWVSALGVAGLLVSWRVIWSDLPQSPGLGQPLTLTLSGYLTFLGILGLLAADRNRRLQAEARLHDWARLLERLYRVAPTHQTLSPQSILTEMLEVLKPFFPSLVGMGLYNDIETVVGRRTRHRYSFSLAPQGLLRGAGPGDDGKAILYFSQPLEDRGNLEALAPLLTERLRQTLALAEWRTQAITDPLTGLLNRRGLERHSRKLIDLARQSGKPVTVAMLDLDHFKRVNDRYGHDTGDRVLQALADVLRRHLRSEDLAVRWGGEEFALLLYGASLQDAYLVLRRIQDELRALRVEPIPWAFTLSAGISGGRVPPSLAVLEDWLLQADWALLQAKDAGRDRVNVVEARKPTDTQAG